MAKAIFRHLSANRFAHGPASQPECVSEGLRPPLSCDEINDRSCHPKTLAARLTMVRYICTVVKLYSKRLKNSRSHELTRLGDSPGWQHLGTVAIAKTASVLTVHPHIEPIMPLSAKQSLPSSPPLRALQSLQTLRKRIQDCESSHRIQRDEFVSSGCEALDELLPISNIANSKNGRGFRTGQLIEWLAAGCGSGAELWGLHIAIQAANCRGHSQQAGVAEIPKSIAVIDHQKTFYPPTAAALGLDLQRLLVIQPKNHADVIWALDQTLRCPRIAAVWSDLPRLNAKDARRLQLAAEEGGSLGIFTRPLTARGQPSWADVQIQVEPLPSSPSSSRHQHHRRWRMKLLRCRGSQPDQCISVGLPNLKSEI